MPTKTKKKHSFHIFFLYFPIFSYEYGSVEVFGKVEGGWPTLQIDQEYYPEASGAAMTLLKLYQRNPNQKLGDFFVFSYFFNVFYGISGVYCFS